MLPCSLKDSIKAASVVSDLPERKCVLVQATKSPKQHSSLRFSLSFASRSMYFPNRLLEKLTSIAETRDPTANCFWSEALNFSWIVSLGDDFVKR